MRAQFFGAVLALAGACSSDPMESAPPMDASVDPGMDAGTSPALVYYRDVRPIIEGRCTQCHNTGGIAPIDFTSYATVAEWKDPIRAAVSTRVMPPWQADRTCGSFSNDRSLTEAEIATIVDWIDLGAPEGDPADARPPLERRDKGLSRVDLELEVPEVYTPQAQDDYRCFVLPWPETTDKYVSGLNVVPSERGVVHHVNVFVVGGAGAQSFYAKQNLNPDPGYPCFGGVFDLDVNLLGSWAPGSDGIEYGDGIGVLVEPGSAIVMEMHFNTDSVGALPDQSTLALKLEDSVTKRAAVAAFWNFDQWTKAGGMPIPAGADDVVHAYDFDPSPYAPLYLPWLRKSRIEIRGVGLHMHYLGKSASLRIKRASGESDCLLEIPDWDFNWQMGYLLETPIPFKLAEDVFSLECHFDNTQAHQPVINGEQGPPRDTEWGTGSTDEMCIGFVLITEG